jgi:hypothetical protein
MEIMKYFLLRLVAAVLFLTLSTPNSFAIMRTAEEMPPIDPRLYTEVVAAVKPPLLIGPIVNIRGLESPGQFSESDWSVIIVRLENDNCLGEKCLTLFLTRHEEAIELVAMGQLPAKMAQGDRFPRACDSCGKMAVFFFEDLDRNATRVSVGAGYAFVGTQ